MLQTWARRRFSRESRIFLHTSDLESLGVLPIHRVQKRTKCSTFRFLRNIVSHNVLSKPLHSCLQKHYDLSTTIWIKYGEFTVRILRFEQRFEDVVHRLTRFAGFLVISDQVSEEFRWFLVYHSEAMDNRNWNSIFSKHSLDSQDLRNR